MRVIETEQDLKKGVVAVTKLCPAIKSVYHKTGDPPLRRREGGFPGLARIVIGQQLSIASANAIWLRFEALVKPMSAKKLLSFTDDSLKKPGLSAGKIKTLRAVSTAIEKQQLNLDKLKSLPEEDIVASLTEISGIGPWTVNVYTMFCLGRADAWAPGDLALQYAVKDLFDLAERPNPKAMTSIAEKWRPWRSVAARLLWAYYKHTKQKNSGVPV